MKRFTTLLAILILSSAAAMAQTAQTEVEKMRFEVSAGTGFPTVLSGPDLSDTTSYIVRLGVYPSEHFQLTLSYDRVNNDIAPNDVLNSYFATEYRKYVNVNANFNDALLTDSTCDIEQWELGMVKAIPIGGSKHFETYIGLGVGMQSATAVLNWTGATEQNPDTGEKVPIEANYEASESGTFFVSVRGGVNWLPVNWFAVQADLRIVPIDSVFEQSLNTLELNFGVVFRFGKM